MEPYYPYFFQARIARFGVGKSRKIYYHVLFLPEELRTQLPFNSYPRLRVEGEIADVPIANAFIPSGDGRHYVIVAPHVLKDGEVSLGDEVEMRFRIADQDKVEVPDQLSAALAQHPHRAEAWQALTPGRQRMLVQHVLSARTAATAHKRLVEVLDALVRFKGDLRAWRKSLP